MKIWALCVVLTLFVNCVSPPMLVYSIIPPQGSLVLQLTVASEIGKEYQIDVFVPDQARETILLDAITYAFSNKLSARAIRTRFSLTQIEVDVVEIVLLDLKIISSLNE